MTRYSLHFQQDDLGRTPWPGTFPWHELTNTGITRAVKGPVIGTVMNNIYWLSNTTIGPWGVEIFTLPALYALDMGPAVLPLNQARVQRYAITTCKPIVSKNSHNLAVNFYRKDKPDSIRNINLPTQIPRAVPWDDLTRRSSLSP